MHNLIVKYGGGRQMTFHILGTYDSSGEAKESFINLDNLSTGEPLRFNRLNRSIELLERDTGRWRAILTDLEEARVYYPSWVDACKPETYTTKGGVNCV